VATKIKKSMKKLIIFSLLILLFAPLSASATSATSTTGLVPCGGTGEDPCTACDLLILFQNVLKFALIIVFLIVIVFIVYGGFRWIFSGGNEANIKAGMKIITNAIVGLMIVLCAWLIVNTVFWLIGQAGGKEEYTGSWWHLECPDILENGVAPAETPAETPSETPTETVSKCSDCGKAIWGYCDEQECLSLGDCEFKAYVLMFGWGYCINK